MSDTKNSEQNTTGSTWRDKTLKAAGYSYVLGDAAMMTADIIRGKKFSGAVKAGAIWAGGGIAAARYGNPDADKQLEIYAGKLESYLKSKGVTIPDDVRAQSELLHSKTLWQHMEQFLYQHPSELLNGAYALGAGMLVAQGMEQVKQGTHTKLPFQGGNLSAKLWIGLIVGTGALVGLLCKEKPDAHEPVKDGNILQRTIASVKQNPLQATSALYFLNNGFLAADAWQDLKSARVGGKFHDASLKPHYFSTLQLAAYLFSNAMLFMSKRNQLSGKGMGEEHIAKLEQAAASIIAAQPPQMQAALLADTSHFMATQKGVTLPPEEIAKQLATRITVITGTRMQEAATAVKSFAENVKERREEASAAEPTRA